MREYQVDSIIALLDKTNASLVQLDQIIAENNRIYSLRLIDDDIRNTVYQDIKVVIGVYTFQLVTIARHHLHYKWWDEIGLSNLTNDQKMSNVSRIHELTLFGVFHMAYATYESALRQIHYCLDDKCCNRSSSNINPLRKCLLNRLSVMDDSCFPFLSAIRNTIHNAGVYRNLKSENASFIFKGQEYNFEHMKPFSFLYPDLLIDLVMSFTEELKPIIESPTVVKIPYVQNIYRQIYKT